MYSLSDLAGSGFETSFSTSADLRTGAGSTSEADLAEGLSLTYVAGLRDTSLFVSDDDFTAGLSVSVFADLRAEGSITLLTPDELSGLRETAELVRVDVSVRLTCAEVLLLWLTTGVFCAVLLSLVGLMDVKSASPSLLCSGREYVEV